jgi:HAE1 family hydrophobic/amphiphilic exporter-1
MDGKELRHFAEKNLQYRLERAPGVAAASVRGGLRRQIHVNLSLKKLRALDLSVAQVVQTLRQENLNRPVCRRTRPPSMPRMPGPPGRSGSRPSHRA